MTKTNKYTDKNARNPIIDPLLLVLKSRRFMTAVVAVIVYTTIQFVPELAPVAAEIGTVLAGLFALVIGAYGVEDAVAAWGKVNSDKLRDELPELIGDMAKEAIDNALNDAVAEASRHLDAQAVKSASVAESEN